MKRFIFPSFIVAVLISSLSLIAACTQSTSPSVSVSGYEPVEVEVWGGRPGTGSYGNSFAMTTVVNHHSEWLTLELVTHEGSVAHIKGIMADPEARPKTIIIAPAGTVSMAKGGMYPFDSEYSDLRGIAACGVSTSLFVTYDPNIKTVSDLVGKRVMIYPKTQSTPFKINMLIEAGIWNLGEDIEFSYGSGEDIAAALRDGTIDVGLLDVGGAISGPYVPGEELERLNAEKPGAFYVGIPETYLHALENLGLFTPILPVLPGTFGPNQKETLLGIPTIFVYWADKVMSDDTTYEIARLLHGNTDEYLAVYPPARVEEDEWALIPIPEEEFHPGALKYYKEAGIKIGLK